MKIVHLLDQISSKIDLLIFPELTLTGFTMRSKRFAEKINGESVGFISSTAEKFDCHVIAGFIEQDEEKYYNTLVHLAHGIGLVCKYRKIHPFSFAGENKHYASGKHPVITEIKGLRLGLSICYDLRFPELYRLYAKERVDVMVDIANWPVDRIEHWHALLKARAIENQCYMIGVNRIGTDKSINYPGWSSVLSPFGDELVCLKDNEEVKIIDIHGEEVKKIRETYPFLKDISLI